MSNEEEYSVRHDIVKTDRKGNSTDKDKVKNKHTKNHNNMSIPVNLPDCEASSHSSLSNVSVSSLLTVSVAPTSSNLDKSSPSTTEIFIVIRTYSITKDCQITIGD